MEAAVREEIVVAVQYPARNGTYLTTINVISNKKSGLFDKGTPAQ